MLNVRSIPALVKICLFIPLMVSCASNSPAPERSQTQQQQAPEVTPDPPKVESQAKTKPAEPDPSPAPVPAKPQRTPTQTAPVESEVEPAPRQVAVVESPKQEPIPVKAAEPETVAQDSPPATAAPQTVTPDDGMRTLEGRINLTKKRGQSIDADEAADTIVYFVADGDDTPVMPKSDYVISTKNKRFEPNVLAIPVGSSVSFPNQDRIIHNVFSVSSISDFDLGFYSPGEVRSYTFTRPGVAFIHCNVHHAMQADVLVLETPWYSQAEADGRFKLEQVPSTPGTLHFWHPRARMISQRIETPNDLSGLTEEVEIVNPKVPKHLNKLGQPYRAERY